jgi:hypothetical protein
MSGSYRKYDEGEDLAKEIKVSHARRPKKGCTSHRFRYEGARAPDDKMFSSSSIGVHDDKYDDFDARNIEYESDCYVSGDRDHERDEVREREISEGLRRRGYNETRTNAPLSDTSSLTSTSTAGHRRDRHLSRKQHGPEDNTSSRGSSPMSAWSCPSPRSPSHLTSKPPSFVPRIRLEAMHAVETSSREGGSAPRGNGSDLALPSPRSAFSDPREE